MKRIIGFLVVATTALSANADCTLYAHRQPRVAKVIQAKGGYNFSKYDVVCEKLRRANAAITIIGESVVLGSQSIGWASVSVKDMNTSIQTTDFNALSTFTNAYASQDKADELMYGAINDALNNWSELDNALATLEQERRKVRKSGAR